MYRRNSIYIGDFLNISAQIHLYRRFSQYIDLLTNTEIHSAIIIRKSCPKISFGTAFSSTT
ncbi:hypothetical protein CN639_02765 [Bacillus toyonensis]|nr:hypothetical protein CON90_17945 [Bacillus toyonensis]PEG15069.1 hypothetical protein COO04_17080 [Bacillus toyonensis]PEJ67334.1 hypothetical protein CN906_01740 [Bacillus toyonensis]PEK11349.1 hypothetical protein CN681_09345 [Bacillus toyonensis]PEK50864.1 hypothetical protein CN588_09310 [Bacillus toyonensis]